MKKSGELLLQAIKAGDEATGILQAIKAGDKAGDEARGILQAGDKGWGRG